MMQRQRAEDDIERTIGLRYLAGVPDGERHVGNA